MVKFYENWQDGMTKRKALRQAKLWYLQERHPSPQYWAPFVLYGVE